MNQDAVVLDVGSSKIVCLDCSFSSRSGLAVHGAGTAEYSGYENGTFPDEQSLTDAVRTAVRTASREAHSHIRSLAVGVPAPFTRLEVVPASVPVSSRNGRIGETEIDGLISASLEFDRPEGYELIHSTPVEFTVNGQVRRDVPLGVSAGSLEGTVSHVFVDTRFQEALSVALSPLGAEAEEYLSSSLAEALFVIPEEERENRAVLIDVGYLHTDVLLVSGGALLASKCIPIGGKHFASDLAFALDVPLSTAENIKRRYVFSLDYHGSVDTVHVPGGTSVRVEHEAIQYVLEARANELSELILSALLAMHALTPTPAPVYLTGGGLALMRGGAQFLSKRLGVSVRERRPWMQRLSSSNYASAFGTVEFVFHSVGAEQTGFGGRKHESSLTRKIRDFFIQSDH